MIADVKRAFFHVKATKLVYAKLPPEDVLPGEEEMCGRLNFSMYGTRDAAANWADEYPSKLLSMGFTQGKATPCVFYLRVPWHTYVCARRRLCQHRHARTIAVAASKVGKQIPGENTNLGPRADV